jgi:Heterokaryon incompatibility protein (HET)
MTEIYQYSTLEPQRSIRVLELAPSKRLDERINCTLIETPVDEAPPARREYEALSYYWGSLPSDREISCHGKTLWITPNCEAALRRLRYKSVSRVLWVDSICINQNSKEEKAQQLKMMAEVYTKAEQVIVFLGEDRTTTTFLALKNLATLQSNKFTSLLVPLHAKLLVQLLSEYSR